MEEPNFLSKEEACIRVNEILASLSNEEQHSLYKISSAFNEVSDDNTEPELKNTFFLLAKVCSPVLNLESRNDPFQPFTAIGNRRSFLPIDLTLKEGIFLSNILDEDISHILKARIADILWVCSTPKNKRYSEIAIENYILINLCDDFFEPDIYTFWQRSALLAKQIKNSTLIEKVKCKLLQEIESPSSGWNFHLLKVIEIFLKTRLDKERYYEFAEKLFQKQYEFNHEEDFHIAAQYLELAGILYQKANKPKERDKCLALLAEVTEKHGDYRKNESALTANHFYKMALNIYREIPSSSRKVLEIDKNLDLIQNKITESGRLVNNEMKEISIPRIDISELQEQSINHVKEKQTPFEAILYFSGVSSHDFESILINTERNINHCVISSLFGETTLSSDGRKVSSIPSLSDENREGVILKTAIKNFGIHIHLAVQGCILPALEQIQQEHLFPKEFLIQLCKFSSIVPDKREILVANALYQGFELDFRSAVHLLAPQVENMVRQRLKQNGIITTHTDPNGIENELGLSSLVALDRAREILGDNLWFELQAVFTDPLSANLRNEVGHGLLDDDTSDSLYSVYAWWMILRLVTRCIKIV